MAMSYTETVKTVFGDKKSSFYSVSLAAVTTGAIKTGYSNLHLAHHNNETTAGAGKVLRNTAADGVTLEYGTVCLVGFTANDIVTLQVVAD